MTDTDPVEKELRENLSKAISAYFAYDNPTTVYVTNWLVIGEVDDLVEEANTGLVYQRDASLLQAIGMASTYLHIARSEFDE